MHKLKNGFIILTSIFYLIFTCNPVLAATFNPEYIISDYELTDAKKMGLEEITEFLNQFSGSLKNYETVDIDGKIKSAAEIIFNASQRHQINPQVIITILQKEQTLVTQKVKKSTQYDWATGFAAYDGKKPVEKFRGFANQVDRAAWRLRLFLEQPWEFVFRPGQIYKISGQLVRPQNLATAALYNYTPFIQGNRLFWQIWQKWFAKNYGSLEDGTLVRVIGDKGVWLIQNGERRPIRSKNIFLARFDFKKVKEISLKELEKYPSGEPVKFPNYSLVQAPNKGVYLLVDDIKRPIISEKIFREIGFNFEEVVKADWSDLALYQDGLPISTPYPIGTLLKNKKTGELYFVKDNFKQLILTEKIKEINYPYLKIIEVDPEKLDGFVLAEPVKFQDGTLIKSENSPTIYLISGGKRHPIADPETFIALGYRWGEVINVSENVLDLHPLDEPIALANETQ